MTTIYLMRHSKPFTFNNKGIEELCDNLLEENKKNPLSIYGEELAKKVSLNKKFQDLDIVISSDYVRAISTAKYFAFNNNLKVNISYRFGERIHGINKWNEIPKDYTKNQFLDENYKIGYGESRKEVRERMFNILQEILKLYSNKKILIVSHSIAITYLLGTWCEINEKNIIYKGNKLLKDKFDFCNTFKLTFDKNNLINIESVNINEN